MQARGDGSVSLKLEKCDTVAAEVKKKEPREREREREKQIELSSSCERTDCLKWRKFPEDWTWSEMQSRLAGNWGRKRCSCGSNAAAGWWCLKGRSRRKDSGGALWCAGRKGLLAAGHGALSAKAVLLCTVVLFEGRLLYTATWWLHCSGPNPARGGGRRPGAPGVARSLSGSAPGEICGCRDTSSHPWQP